MARYEQRIDATSRARTVPAKLPGCLAGVQPLTARALELAQQEPLGWAQSTALAVLYHAVGQQEKAQEHLQQVSDRYGQSASYQLGQIYAQFGDTDAALGWLENAARIRDPGVIQANDDRLLIPLRGEPRFQAILKAVGHS